MSEAREQDWTTQNYEQCARRCNETGILAAMYIRTLVNNQFVALISTSPTLMKQRCSVYRIKSLRGAVIYASAFEWRMPICQSHATWHVSNQPKNIREWLGTVPA